MSAVDGQIEGSGDLRFSQQEVSDGIRLPAVETQ